MAYLFGNFADNNLNGEYMAGLRYKDPPAIVDRTSIEGGILVFAGAVRSSGYIKRGLTRLP